MLLMSPEVTNLSRNIRNVKEAMSRSMDKLSEDERLLMMTPGPTEIPPTVKKAMSQPMENPNIQSEFYDFYHSLEDKLQKVYGTEDDIIILSGEGILGLEASVASLVDEGDKVLCISNGVFGDGFADFVKMYGGEPVICDFPYDKPLNKERIDKILEQEDFKVATMVHCETPTGTLNYLDGILESLKQAGVITVVDAVSSLGGVPIPMENIDICIGGSQKCLSSPPGLAILSVSEDAWNSIQEKEGKDQHFYTSLKVWKDNWFEKERFPYTPSVSNLYALDEAVDLISREGKEYGYIRHEETSNLCRKRAKQIGFDFFPETEELCSPTVTALEVEGQAKRIQKELKEKYDILLATGLGDLREDIIRVGHMGFNAKEKNVKKTMDALEDVVR